MLTFSRDETADWAGLTRPQLNHLSKLGVIRPDVGGERKKLSLFEARMTAVAAAFMRLRINPKELLTLMDAIRAKTTGPFGDQPYTVEEMAALRQIEIARLVAQEGRKDATSLMVKIAQSTLDQTADPRNAAELAAMPREWSDEQLATAESAIAFRRGCEQGDRCFILVDLDRPDEILEITTDGLDAMGAEGWVTLDVGRLFARIGPMPPARVAP